MAGRTGLRPRRRSCFPHRRRLCRGRPARCSSCSNDLTRASTPSDRVLDVGCGAGRARRRPLTGYLGPSGSYEGFDSQRRADRLVQRAHRAAPSRASGSSRRGRLQRPVQPGTPRPQASEYTFPYADGEFDVRRPDVRSSRTCSPEDVTHYLGRDRARAEAGRPGADHLVPHQRRRPSGCSTSSATARHDPASTPHDAWSRPHDFGPAYLVHQSRRALGRTVVEY